MDYDLWIIFSFTYFLTHLFVSFNFSPFLSDKYKQNLAKIGKIQKNQVSIW